MSRSPCQIPRTVRRSALRLAVVLAALLLAACGKPPAQPSPASAPAQPPPQQTNRGAGTALFRDKLATADQLVITLTGVPNSPANQAYQAWLVSDDQTQFLSAGLLRVRPDGSVEHEFSTPGSDNLILRFAAVQITLEPAAGSSRPTGKPVLAGAPQPEAWQQVRQAFAENRGKPATPLNTPFARGLQEQMLVATQHMQNAASAAGIGSRPGARLHMEHVVNIIVGRGSERYGDHDGDGQPTNPGDGFGVREYAAQLLPLLGSGTAADSVTGLHAALDQVVADVLAAMALDPAALSDRLKELLNWAEQLRTGTVAALYRSAQGAARFEIQPAR
jgi:hypothetical protein